VIGQVGGDLFLRSEQDANEYHRKDVAAGFDAAIGTGGGSASGYVSAAKVDSTYRSVIEQTGIQAGEGGFHIDVAGKTTLDGAAIASTADPELNYFRTGSLEWKDIVNEAKFKATQASVSGGGGTGGGSVTGSFQNKSDSATSTTHAGIAGGTLIVDDGSGAGIARGVTELQQDGLKEIFDARKVAEQLQIQQVAGELGFQAAGTLAEKMGWAEGSKEKVALHAAVGAAVAALGGGNVLGGAAGAALNQQLVPVLRKAIEDAGVKESDNPATFNALMQAASLAVGSVAGASGASTALAADVNNRQLHPIEKKVISEEIAERYARDHGVTVEQAQRTLEAQLLRMVDANAAAQGGWDQEATNYLKGYANRVGNYSIGNDQWGNSVPLFGTSAGYQRQDSTIFSAHPQTSMPPPKLGWGAAAGYFEGVAGGISGAVSDTISAIAHPLDTAGKVWDSVSALFSDPVGTGQAMQEATRPMADAAQQGDLKPAGEQIGQQVGNSGISLGTGLTGKWLLGKWIPGDSVVDAGIRWGKGVQGQGMPWEDYLAKQLPAGSRLPPNFPTFDFYDIGSKTAISAKTLDTTTPSKIANPRQIFSSLKGSIDTAANFDDAKKGTINLERSDIISYELRVAVPEKTTLEQWKQIEKSIEYGRQRGVAVRITKVR